MTETVRTPSQRRQVQWRCCCSLVITSPRPTTPFPVSFFLFLPPACTSGLTAFTNRLQILAVDSFTLRERGTPWRGEVTPSKMQALPMSDNRLARSMHLRAIGSRRNTDKPRCRRSILCRIPTVSPLIKIETLFLSVKLTNSTTSFIIFFWFCPLREY